jgi:hypothetical protein
MSLQTACSSKATPKEVAAEISARIKECDPRLVIFFASAKYDPAQISAELSAAFSSCVVYGCSTAGELISGAMLKGSVVAMGFGSDIIEDVAVEVIEEIRSRNDTPKAFAAFEKHFGQSLTELDIDKHVGLILVDGLQGAEEKLMEKIGDLTDIHFIGGSAGDDLAFKKTFVFAHGKSFTNAAILAVLKVKKGFSIIKTQSFCPMPKTLKATKVDEATRTVLEFNGKPALTAYAEALGVKEADAASQFMSHPLGLLSAEGQPFVRSPQQIKDQAMVFYCNIKEGMELSLLSSTDIVGDTREAVLSTVKALGTVEGMINFHCILRTLELEQKNLTEAYGKVFSAIPTIGFSTYGEEYIGHINQTSTILVFK